MIFHTQRPFQVLKGIEGKRLETATGYSFPSGHTQSSTTFFVSLYLLFRKKWMIFLMILIPLLVGISRMYLGVHWPIDVLGGWCFGIVFSLISCYFISKYYDSKKILRTILLASLGLIFLALLCLVLINNTYFRGNLFLSDTFKVCGIFTGVILGFLLEENLVAFTVAGTTGLKIGRYIVGVLITFLLMSGLKKIFPELNIFHFIRYFLTGFWVSFVFPFLGVKMKMFSKEEK